MKILNLTSLFSILTSLLPSATPIYLDTPALLQKAEDELPHIGILKQNAYGFVYLEVDNRYIDELLPILKNDKIKPPPYFGEEGVGTHATIITAEEAENKRIRIKEEIGEKIPFTIVSLASVKSENLQAVDQFYYLKIHAPRLEEIRKKYGLSPTFQDHDFHITIGWLYKNGASKIPDFPLNQ